MLSQLQMLRYHAKEKGFEVIGEYVDDGFSGTTFNRPDLNRVIEDAMADTEPSGIMVKDMSRFGRNNAINCSMLVELIDSIYVYQAEGTGKVRKQKVEINYRFLAGSQCGIA